MSPGRYDPAGAFVTADREMVKAAYTLETFRKSNLVVPHTILSCAASLRSVINADAPYNVAEDSTSVDLHSRSSMTNY